jgi:hypothetical protein
MTGNFRDYMCAQVHEIEIFKWIESEKAGQDLGQEAVKNWIKFYSKSFRESWENAFTRS